MAGLLNNRIVMVIPDAKTHTVAVRWASGAETTHSFAHLVGKGVFAAFSDPAIFEAVTIGRNNYSLVWPGEIDMDADSLWFESHPEDNPFSTNRPAAAE